ncbi:MAG: NlpC/P60 family protein [Patescibacteria group bacterium]
MVKISTITFSILTIFFLTAIVFSDSAFAEDLVNQPNGGPFYLDDVSAQVFTPQQSGQVTDIQLFFSNCVNVGGCSPTWKTTVEIYGPYNSETDAEDQITGFNNGPLLERDDIRWNGNVYTGNWYGTSTAMLKTGKWYFITAGGHLGSDTTNGSQFFWDASRNDEIPGRIYTYSFGAACPHPGWNTGAECPEHFFRFGAPDSPLADMSFRIIGILQPNPIIVSLQQYKSDATTTISEGGTTTEDSVIFGAILESSSTNQLTLEVEVATSTANFTGVATATSIPVSSEAFATTTVTNIAEGSYYWRGRAVDMTTSVVSNWQEFGVAGDVDFVVSFPLATKAANLAKKLVNSVYLYGGKGWDYDSNTFVNSDVIKTGYNYWDLASNTAKFGVGVDCSGLIMWAFDRSFDPNKSRLSNFVKAEGADEQFRQNTTSTTETQLKPGDVMFFDFDSNGFIDHVAMYVGGNGGYDVVSAVDPETGIVGRLKDDLKQPSTGFVAFKHVVSAIAPPILASAGSPIDLIVTDPDRFTITPTTTILSDLEYLRQIPGVLYYSEMEKGTDGNPIDQVYSYATKTGDYTIQVLPAAGASPTSTYTLDFSAGGQSIILASSTSINQIPSQGYGVTTSATGTVSSFIPVAIDIKPGSYPNSINLGSNGVVPVAIFGSATFDVGQIDPTTIKLANASIQLKGNGQPQASYSDANGDGFIDIIGQISTEAFQLTSSDVKANLDGQLTSGTIIKGSDSVRVVP